ncbi:PaaI family thioesterase [Acuticoccus mangrovi]|uniref:PaaI family thioesterase n=1 Tax=Acuticoccus mangrovi TaxID=2796142 RepID=A0A934MJY0_9HYPH|nr:PaaI family thioesterase [Acuticoccus mangrovi]MBJ3778781.1 PaaI family thioesterase [Acuticoccus mangrovi]
MLITDGTPAQSFIGYVIDVPDEPGEGAGVAVSLDITEDHFNRHGTVHGGIIAVLMDTVCGMQCSFEGDPKALPKCMTLSLTTQFVAPVRLGRVTARAHSAGGGKRIRYLNAWLEDADGKTLSTASAVMRMV